MIWGIAAGLVSVVCVLAFFHGARKAEREFHEAFERYKKEEKER
jgi:hypothetical protein